MYTYLNKYPGENLDGNGNFGACAITPDGTTLAVGGFGDSINTRGRIVVYNTNDFSVKGNIIRGIAIFEGIGYTVDINDDGNRIFSACTDNKSRVWNYNSGTNMWDLIYTTSAGNAVLYGLSIRCNSLGTVFFVTEGNGDNPPTGTITFHSYIAGSWSPDFNRDNLPNPERYSWVADSNSSITSIVGTTQIQGENALVSTYNGSSWSLKGSPIGSGNCFVGSGMSQDGDTVVLFDYKPQGGSAVYVYDWNGSNWILRGSIDMADCYSRCRIVISSDKNTIAFTGSSSTSSLFGVWTWDGSAFQQDLSFYNEILANNGNNVNYVSGLRVPAMSGDKSLVASPYQNIDGINSIDEYGFVTFSLGSPPPTPLITAVDDDYTSQTFNVNPHNLRLITSPPYNILANDTYTAPQSAGTGTIVLNGIDGEAVLDSNGDFYITTDHLVGDYSFTYVVTDNNAVDSNSATVSYKVVNFGIDNNSVIDDIPDVFINTLTEIFDQFTLVDPIMSSADHLGIDIDVVLVSGDSPSGHFNAGDYNDGFSYEVEINHLGQQQVVVTYTYNGEQLSWTRYFNVVPLPTAVDDFSVGSPFVVSGITGGTTTSITANDSPSTGGNVSIVDDGGLTGVSFNSSTGGLDIPAGSTPGDYVVVYETDFDLAGTNQANVYIRVSGTPSPSPNSWVVDSTSIESFLVSPPVNTPPPVTTDVAAETSAGVTIDTIIGGALIVGLGIFIFMWLFGLI